MTRQPDQVEILTRVAMAPAATESMMAGKVKALAELAKLGEASRIPMEAIREELAAVAWAETSTSRGLDAVLTALRLLDQLDGEPDEAEQDAAAIEEARRSWLALDLLADMANARGLRLTADGWRAGGPEIAALRADAEVIMGAEDPLGAFDAWRKQQAT